MNNIDFDTVIWDFNGTLIDDTSACVKSINKMLSDRGKKTLTEASYRDVFSFPVKSYYERIGFDFETEKWDTVADEFIRLYSALISSCPLFPAACELVRLFSENRMRQYVLSAMEQDMLQSALQSFGLMHFFSGVYGKEDIFADSKIAVGQVLLRINGINPEKAVLIGDTSHDFETAQALGVRCILISSGHQSARRLEETGCTLVYRTHQHLIEELTNK